MPGAKALAISSAMEVFISNMTDGQLTCVFINQVRNKIGVAFGSPEVMPGGEALPFYSSVILKLKTAKMIVDSSQMQHGVVVRPTVQKSRFRPTNDKVEIPLMYGKGICDEESWVSLLSKYDAVDMRRPGYYTFVWPDGKKETTFTKKTIVEVMKDNPGLEAALFAKIAKASKRKVLPGEELFERELSSEEMVG